MSNTTRKRPGKPKSKIYKHYLWSHRKDPDIYYEYKIALSVAQLTTKEVEEKFKAGYQIILRHAHGTVTYPELRRLLELWIAEQFVICARHYNEIYHKNTILRNHITP